MLEIRSYQRGDWPALVDLFNRFWSELSAMDTSGRLVPNQRFGAVYGRRLLRRLASSAGVLLWAVLDGRRVGMTAAAIERQTPQNRLELGPRTEGRILDLFVEPDVRRQGIGRALLRQAEEHLAAGGCQTIKVEVLGSNSGAHRLYRRLGYADWVTDLYKQVCNPDTRS